MFHNAYWEIICYGPWPHCLQYSRWLKFASEASGPQKTKKRLGGNFKFSGCGKKWVPAADTPPPPSEKRPHAAAAAFSAAPTSVRSESSFAANMDQFSLKNSQHQQSSSTNLLAVI